MENFNVPLQVKLVRWSRYLTVAVIAIALFVLLGWQLDIRELRRPLPELATMNPLTAVLFTLSAISLLLTISVNQNKSKSIIAFILGTIVTLLGLLKFITLFTNTGWEPDMFFFRDKLTTDIVGNVSNSMAGSTAFCFILSGIGLCTFYYESYRKSSSAQYLAIIIALISWLSVLGHLYQVKANSVSGVLAHAPMAFQTAICFLCISLAFLFAQPGKGIMRQFTTNFGGRLTARLLLPAAVLVPTIIGLIRLEGSRAGIYDDELGVAIHSMVIICIFLGLAWYITTVLNKRDSLKKQTEDALRSSEEEMAALFEAAPDAIVVINDQSGIIKWNPGAEKLFGWTSGEVFGKSLTETIIPPEFGEAHKKGLQRFLRTGNSTISGRTIEITAIKKDQSFFEVALRIAPVVVKDSAMFVGFIRDITEQKKRDQQLKNFNAELSHQVDEKTKKISEARDLADKLIDSLPGIFFFYDENGKYIRWNKEMETATGYSAEEIAGMHPSDFFEGEQKTYILERIRQVFTKGVNDAETELVTKAGKKIPYYFKAVLINYEGRPCQLGTGIDVTEQKEAEKRLRISEQKYKLLFFSNPRPMYMLSLPDYKLIEVNSAAILQYGYTREEFLQLSAFDLRPEEEYEKFRSNMSTEFRGIKHAGIWRHKKKDGTIIYVDITTHDILYEDRPARLVLADDVTEKYEAEEKLKASYGSIRKLTEHLQQVREEERTHIAREIHDELGQQLTVLKMDLAWLNKKMEPDDQQVKQKIKDLLGMIDTTVKTVRRIAAELRPSLLDDLGLIPAMEWHLEEFEKRSGIRTGFSKPQTNHQLSDEIKIGLFRIFQESLTNVARHSSASAVYVRLEETDQKVILTIADDGLGFKEENASKRTLGILGMKERTLMLGGEYTITGEPGKGTTVFVSVPLNGAGDNNNKK